MQIAAWGPWLPGEERFLAPKWFYDALFPPEPIDMNNTLTRALEETRGNIPYT